MPDSGKPRSLREQLSSALMVELAAEGISQADLARDMGLSAKHVNALVNGKSGALGIYDFAAFTLGRKWEVRLV